MISIPCSVLTVKIPDQPLRCYRFGGDRIQIGRGQNNHLKIDRQAISNVHCEIVHDETLERWIFRDLASTNGCRVNGRKLDGDALSLQDGDRIMLGDDVELHYLVIRSFDVPEEPETGEEEDSLVNPVAAAVARQSREELEGTQLVKVRPPIQK